jgi:hypothetical protein
MDQALGSLGMADVTHMKTCLPTRTFDQFDHLSALPLSRFGIDHHMGSMLGQMQSNGPSNVFR